MENRDKGRRIGIWVLTFLIACCYPLSGQVLRAEILPNKLTPVEILQIEWGNGDGQVGLLRVPGENYGPQSFSVDEKNGKIHIVDSTNQRVLVYDLTGNPLSFTPISDRADDLCLGGQENLYVLYAAEKKVVEYDLNGSIIATYPLVNTKTPITGIRFSRDQTLFFETADEYSYPLAKQGAKLDVGAQSKGKILGFSSNDSYFFLERRGPSRGSIRLLDSDGKVKKELSVTNKEGRIETLIFIGADEEENIYIALEESTSSFEVKRYLKKYDPEGVLLAEALIPYSNYAYTFNTTATVLF